MRGQIWRAPYLLDSLLKCREREWGYCFKFWKALTGQAHWVRLVAYWFGMGCFFGDRYRGGGWVVGGWAKSGESFALAGANALCAFGGLIVLGKRLNRKS